MKSPLLTGPSKDTCCFNSLSILFHVAFIKYFVFYVTWRCTDAAEGPFLILPDGPRGLSISLHLWFLSESQDGLLFVSCRYQFPSIYWANLFQFPFSIQILAFASSLDPLVPSLRGFPDDPNRRNRVWPGLSRKVWNAITPARSTKENGTRRTGHCHDLMLPIGN